MPYVGLSIDGGVSTEAGPSAPFVQKQDGTVSIPWLIDCTNCVYNLDGWPQKMPGATNVNSSATGATDAVNGIFDFWLSGTGASQSQQRMIYSNTVIYSESGGTLTSRKTGLEAGMMPWFEVMNDLCVIATSSSTDVPMSWDQTTFQNLAGTPPNFDFCVEYKDRMWAAGVDTNKSRLYYSVSANPASWVAAGSGSIDVGPDDGDVITGLRRHKDELIVFKGPNRGSIYRISGSAPTGADAFVLAPFIKGVGATNQQAIIGVRDDVIFWDDNGIHSLVATAAFGDYNEAFVSRDITTYFTKSLNHNRFPYVWGCNATTLGYALWTVARAGSQTNDLIILWDYRFNPARFAFWDAYTAGSLAMVRDTSREVTPWMGSYTGRVRRMNQAARDIATTAYQATVTFPYLSFGDASADKMALKGRLGYNPKGQTTITVGWQRDGQSQQTASVTQSGTSSLGTSSDQFILDTSTLGGGRYEQAFFDMSGSFKEIQMQLTQGTVDVDMEPHGLALEIEGAGIGTTAVKG